MIATAEHGETKYTNSARYKCLEFLRKTGVDLYLCYCGIEECDPCHHYGPIKRSEYLLHCILTGKGTYTANGKTWQLGKNQTFLICPEETTYYEADHDDPWTYLWVAFNGVKARQYLEYANLNKDNLIGEYSEPEKLLTYVRNMLDASKLTYTNELRREGYLFLFLSALMEAQGKTRSNVHDYSFQIYVEHALEFIEHQYQTDIKVSDIADYIGINRSYLTACFQKSIGMSPQQYLIRYRMEKARDLLKTTDLSINAIASEVGYADALAFSRSFRQMYDSSPKDFRRKTETTFETDIIAEH